MIELGYEYKVMACRNGTWEAWTGIWDYESGMTVKKIRRFMYHRWDYNYNPANYDKQLDYGIFRRMVIEDEGKKLRRKWELIKMLRWSR